MPTYQVVTQRTYTVYASSGAEARDTYDEGSCEEETVISVEREPEHDKWVDVL